MPHIHFIAGESSGDQHGAALIRALRALDLSLTCEGLGGVRMAAEGMALRHDLAGEAIMGFAEVVKHFPAIRRLLLDTVEHIRATRPDAVVLIDYPGFNIALAKRIRALGIPVIYYISPQVWAWKRKRIHTIAANVDKMLVIFPFEEALYRAVGLACAYVGHPLVEHTAGYAPSRRLEGEPLIGLLPGSRKQEISRLLEPMLEVARGLAERYPKARFAVPCVNEGRAKEIRALAAGFPLDVMVGGSYDILSAARFCLVASGTATVETALFDVPMLILYRVNPVTYRLARMLVKGVEHIGMVNILAGREIVPEFIQDGVEPARILPKAIELVDDSPARAQMLRGLAEVRAKLGGGGASACAAREILATIQGGTDG